MRVFEGSLLGQGLRLAVVASRFNELITGKLVEGALDALRRHGVADDDIDVAWTPGTFEIPLVARRLATTGRYDALCCVGAVIRGGTPHFDYVASQVARGIAQATTDTGVPMAFGVVTTDTLEQAIERAGTKAGNKGFDAAVSAIEMAQLMRQIAAAER
ncbi:MAG: 6,7-dimethyl-8-ribityllumazine synthase [Myxococcota bacterium]